MGRRTVAAAAALMALMALARPAPASAQRIDRQGLVRVSAFAAGSFREGPTGFGVARDVVSYSLRLTLPRGAGMHPWLQAGWFVRPDLECPADLTCNTEGWTARGGVTLPLSTDDTRPGLHPYLLAGIGMAFSEEDELSWLFGFGTALALTPRLAPALELHWDQLPGIRNVLMLNLGLRIGLF